MVECAAGLVGEHGAHDFTHVADFGAGADDDGAGGDDLGAVGVFLGHGEAVLAGGDVDLEGTAEVGEGFYGAVEAGVLALLRAAGPHPVGAEADAVEALGEGRPDDVGEALGHGEDGAGGGVGEAGLWRVAQGGGYACTAAVVEGYDAAVGEGQLEGTLALLACDLTGDGAVDFVGEPVFAGNRFKGEDSL